MPVRFSRADTEAEGPAADARRERLRSLGIERVVAYKNGSATIHQTEFVPFRALHGESFWHDLDRLCSALSYDHERPFDEVRADLRTEVDLARRAANPARYEARDERTAARTLARQEAAARRLAEQERALAEWKRRGKQLRRTKRAEAKVERHTARDERLRAEVDDLRRRARERAEEVRT